MGLAQLGHPDAALSAQLVAGVDGQGGGGVHLQALNGQPSVLGEAQPPGGKRLPPILRFGDHQLPVLQGQRVVIHAPVPEGVAMPVGVVVHLNVAVDHSGAVADGGAELPLAVAIEVAEEHVPDGHPADQDGRAGLALGGDAARRPAEGDAGIFLQPELGGLVPGYFFGVEVVHPYLGLRALRLLHLAGHQIAAEDTDGEHQNQKGQGRALLRSGEDIADSNFRLPGRPGQVGGEGRAGHFFVHGVFLSAL